MPKNTQWKHFSTSLLFSVQERRDRSRMLQERSNKKAAFLSLGTHDVAHRLKLLQPPERIMDDRVDTDIDHTPSRRGSDVKNFDNFNQLHSSSKAYEEFYKEWMEKGFQIDSWRPLLMSELYHPLESQQKYFEAKYSLASKRVNRSVEECVAVVAEKEGEQQGLVEEEPLEKSA